MEPARSSASIPYGTTAYYAGLAASDDPNQDPIAAQIYPRPQEHSILPYESSDPIADQQYLIAERLIHHYHDRALMLVNDRCATYCRHCFRRHFTGNDSGRITPAQLSAACDALASRPQINEILLSGGDPLMLGDDELERILRALREVNPDYIIRIATRIPIVLPRRITERLTRLLAIQPGLWMVIQANHPRELTPEFSTAVARIRQSGIPLLNQAVLLRGVNDDAVVLEELFKGLLRNGVKPYYLFQGDLASGTRHFRTSIEHGLQLMDTLRSRISGMALPVYAVDLPGGGGKIPLNRETLVRTEKNWYVLQDLAGNHYRYPREIQKGET
ncbi:KamA family radical SAM protein [Spirochaeta africana]|uniref:KamA family protein n=1 Tax=Spirochaeta africana (strain ATCC 700263 / DSM 8902 / Z-7692) TaxID=889378 RepID=H9UJN1_SPIAZ|nr:KamA family radical SAM protein [Spirochaeta africana]AFG37724.1 KamA family protein [Spirochaeta africana DSM 8902]